MPYVDSNSMISYPFSVDKSFDCYSLTSPYTASLGRQGLGNLIPALPSPWASFRTADAFRVTWSEKVPGRSSRIRHRNVLTEKAWKPYRDQTNSGPEFVQHLYCHIYWKKKQRSTTGVLVNFCPSYTNLSILSKKTYRIQCSREHFHIF